jgi:hypothetical protein
VLEAPNSSGDAPIMLKPQMRNNAISARLPVGILRALVACGHRDPSVAGSRTGDIHEQKA